MNNKLWPCYHSTDVYRHAQTNQQKFSPKTCGSDGLKFQEKEGDNCRILILSARVVVFNLMAPKFNLFSIHFASVFRVSTHHSVRGFYFESLDPR